MKARIALIVLGIVVLIAASVGVVALVDWKRAVVMGVFLVVLWLGIGAVYVCRWVAERGYYKGTIEEYPIGVQPRSDK